MRLAHAKANDVVCIDVAGAKVYTCAPTCTSSMGVDMLFKFVLFAIGAFIAAFIGARGIHSGIHMSIHRSIHRGINKLIGVDMYHNYIGALMDVWASGALTDIYASGSDTVS